VGQPDVGQPDVGERDVGDRDVGERDVRQRDMRERDVGQRGAGERDVGDRDVGQRGAGQPAAGTDGAAVPDKAALDLPLYLRLLWHGEDTDRPGPKRGVDLRTIGAAGVKIADAEGLSAVSMRKLAGELGFTTMALYRYVQSKGELMMLLLDAAYAGLPTIDPAVGWRDQISQWAVANRQVILEHPWALQVPISEPPLTPNQIGWMEIGLEALAGTNLPEQEKLSCMLLVDVYVRGQAQLSVGVGAGVEQLADEQLYGRRLQALVDPREFPRLTAAIGSGALEDDGAGFAVDEFGFGLKTVLDGIAARVAGRFRP